MRRTATTLALTAALLASGACGDDDDGGSASVGRYCDLAGRLDDITDDIETGDTAEELSAAVERVLDDNRELLDDLEDAAPDDIKAEVEEAIDAMEKAAGGDLEAVEAVDSDKLDKFEQENCD